eukprot:CAMPEP_0179176128 /NCGR_PEP_ID=MMETSP0796-20121207/87057_1 /TAXON_ID=73915 /ORGANISM="Pyrodinium bahamense, Strain pbaha01" /LENGTH=264 /DNA_ID=CAMNT_0020879603 /DNA_START=135 /DNA_END=924 /DNA_ORIENTATION=+
MRYQLPNERTWQEASWSPGQASTNAGGVQVVIPAALPSVLRVGDEAEIALRKSRRPRPGKARLDEQHVPVGPAHAPHLAERCRRVLDRAEAERGHHGVKGCVREGQALGVAADHPGREGQVHKLRARLLEHHLEAVHPHEAPDLAALLQSLKAAASTDSHLEDVPPGLGEVLQAELVCACLLVGADRAVPRGREEPLEDLQPLPLGWKAVLLPEAADALLVVGVVPPVSLGHPNHQPNVDGTRCGDTACPMVPLELAGSSQQES